MVIDCILGRVFIRYDYHGYDWYGTRVCQWEWIFASCMEYNVVYVVEVGLSCMVSESCLHDTIVCLWLYD